MDAIDLVESVVIRPVTNSTWELKGWQVTWGAGTAKHTTLMDLGELVPWLKGMLTSRSID